MSIIVSTRSYLSIRHGCAFFAGCGSGENNVSVGFLYFFLIFLVENLQDSKKCYIFAA